MPHKRMDDKDIKEKWAKLAEKVAHIDELMEDVVNNVGDILGSPGFERYFRMFKRWQHHSVWLADRLIDRFPNWPDPYQAFQRKRSTADRPLGSSSAAEGREGGGGNR